MSHDRRVRVCLHAPAPASMDARLAHATHPGHVLGQTNENLENSFNGLCSALIGCSGDVRFGRFRVRCCACRVSVSVECAEGMPVFMHA